MAKGKKISEKEFWAILRKNAGLFARTARAIEKTLGIPYSRQAVRERAEKDPAQLAEIQEENIDIAEEGLHDLMRSGQDSVKLRAIELYLKSKGSHRGYFDKADVNHNGKVIFEFIDP
jgi:hypothetical protein